MQDVLIGWTSEERVFSLRATIQAEEQARREAAKAEAEKQEVRALPYCVIPEFETPEFETACLVVRDFWNRQAVGLHPLRQLLFKSLLRTPLRI
ncbi:Uncharacterised protein [Neisseria meningitidis]|nr:Uncharacterised protein [Neisseria meningitidis]